MFQFQLLIDRVIGVPEMNPEGMTDRELIEFIQSRDGERELRRSIISMERKIEELKNDLKTMHQKWVRKRERAKRADTTPSDRKIIHAKMFHIEEQIKVIENKVVYHMLEEIRLLKKLLIDTKKTSDIIENGGSLTDDERRTIVNALKGT